MSTAPSFTGRARQRQTRWSVKAIDRLAGTVIGVGGVGAIVAVLAVCVFLVWVALPLLFAAEVSSPRTVTAQWAADGLGPAHVEVNDAGNLAWGWFPAKGQVDFCRLDGGTLQPTPAALTERAPTVASFGEAGAVTALGFDDGAIQLGRVEFAARDLDRTALPAEVAAQLDRGEPAQATVDDGIVVRTSHGVYRWHGIDKSFDLPQPGGGTAAVRLIDSVVRGNQQWVATVDVAGAARLLRLRRGDAAKPDAAAAARIVDLPYPPASDGTAPRWLMLSALADAVHLAWEDGRLVRLVVQGGKIKATQEVDLAPDADAKLTSLVWLAGRTTLVAGDSRGGVSAWFAVRPENDSAVETQLVRAHQLPPGPAAVAALDASPTLRTIAAAYSDGATRLLHVTSHKRLAEVRPLGDAAPLAVALAPKNDLLAVWSADRASLQHVNLRHPEANLASLFAKVWYEGYAKPEHVWQSSSGSDDFEPKLGFIPLVFGTLKATFYSLLFAVPISLLAAIYTSEFMSPGTRLRVKPMVELMASLPSVVLGFLAGLVLAPWVEAQLPSVLLTVAAVPLGWLLGAHLWQLLPMSWTLRLPQMRIVALALVSMASALVAWRFGPLVEQRQFAGDVRLWLSGTGGQSTAGSGWWVLLLCPAALVVGWFAVRHVNPWLQRQTAEWTRSRCAWAELAKFLSTVAAALALAAAGAWLLARAGFDPRGSFLGGYDQRNALVVGFVMGFAIVPIIYTIAEDALSSVPEHLRSAALGAGATPWQTAVTVVIPTAMSGLFSAIMVGLGRAVGETMIVLMAAGNTPVMDWNIFNGFRTLSANIAVEISEAPQNSTHYRTLFLAALTLFAMTFVINSLAEWVRQKFRKRAYQL